MKDSKGLAPIIIIVIGVIVLAGAGGGIYFGQKIKSGLSGQTFLGELEKQAESAQQEPQKTASESLKSSTADWKTCKGQDGIYEFKYPSIWYELSSKAAAAGYCKAVYTYYPDGRIFQKDSKENDAMVQVQVIDTYFQKYNYNPNSEQGLFSPASSEHIILDGTDSIKSVYRINNFSSPNGFMVNNITMVIYYIPKTAKAYKLYCMINESEGNYAKRQFVQTCDQVAATFKESYQEKGGIDRDGLKIAGLKKIQLALELYFDKNKNYPVSTKACNDKESYGLEVLWKTGTIDNIPRDPSDSGRCFLYKSGIKNGTLRAYHLGIDLETSSSALNYDTDCDDAVGTGCPSGVVWSSNGPNNSGKDPIMDYAHENKN